MDRKRVREPSPVGSVCRAAPTSLYTPGSRDSSALSIIPARLTRMRVKVSDLLITAPALSSVLGDTPQAGGSSIVGPRT